MSKVVEKAEELKKDVVEVAEEAGKELQDVATDLVNGDEKKPNKFVEGLKKYGIPALAFGLGWAAKTAWTMFTSTEATSAIDAGKVVDMPVAGSDSAAV